MFKGYGKFIVVLYAVCSIIVAIISLFTLGTDTETFMYFWMMLQIIFSTAYFSMIFIWILANPPRREVKAKLDEAPEEFKRLLAYMEEKNLFDYDGLKLKLIVSNCIYNTCKCMLWIGIFLLFATFEGLDEIFLQYSILILVVSIVGITLTKRIARETDYEYKYLYKREIIPTLVNWMNNNLQYVPLDSEKVKEYEKLYIQSEFDKNLEYVDAEDYIEGLVVANTYVKMADVAVGRENLEGENVRIFRGLFAHFDNINYLNFKEIAVRSEKDYYKVNTLKVSTNNKQFNKDFTIYTSNDYAVRKMEMTGFLDAVVALRKKYDCVFDFIIREGEIYIQIDLDTVFEPDLWDRTKGRLPLYKHYLQYKLLFDIFFLVRELVEHL